MRRRTKDKHLPACVYQKHGAYWLVKKGKWTRLGADLQTSLEAYAKLVEQPKGGMSALIDEAIAARKLAPNTLKAYRLASAKLKKILAEFSPEQVQTKHVVQIKRAFQDKPSKCNTMLSVLRITFDYALDEQLVDTNPSATVKMVKTKSRERLISDAEFAAVQQAATPAYAAMMDILYLTAQRIGDVLKIRHSDISSDGIRFHQQKTGHKMMVAMSPDLSAALERARSAREGVIKGMTLFHTKRGRPYAYGTIRDMHNRACMAAGVSDFHIHDIRAKSLTDAQAQGLDATVLAGHESEKTTDIYLRSKEVPVAQSPVFGRAER